MSFKSNFLSFYKDRHKSYVLNYSISEVFNVINNIPRSTGLWSTNNIILKYFDGKSFSIQLIRIAYSRNQRLSSNLYGEIEKKNDLETIVRIQIKNSPGTNILSVIFILIGFIYCGKFLFFKGDIVFLLWAGLMIVVFPLLLNWYKKVSDTAIRENFEDYLYKGLKSN